MSQDFPRKRLGDYLLSKGLITAEKLEQALTEQQRNGGLLGQIIQANSDQSPLHITQILASQQGMDAINLLETTLDPGLLSLQQIEEYLLHQALPYRRNADGITLIAITAQNAALEQWATATFPHHRFVLTSQRDIHQSLQRLFPDYFTQLGTEKLWRESPELSARQTIFYPQKLVILTLLTTLFCGGLAVPSALGVWLLLGINLLYGLTLLFKTLLLTIGALRRDMLWQSNLGDSPFIERTHHSDGDRELPIFTILIPLYDEARSLPGLLESLRNLDYPANKLDIKLIVEADDHETFGMAKMLRPEGRFEIIAVPYSLPRTKPKACNYALRFARGEFVTIYDAEDRPASQQLRHVVRAFRHGPEHLVCVQCRLNYYNREHNLLTRLFAIEYASWFDFMLPGLNALGLPIPLGGTSNHIALAKLKALGEWDAYNVTEDADLGIRMAAHGFTTRTLASETLEEAPPHLWMWIKQRSRWIKGYMQTWLVHMRHPIRLWMRLGAKQFFGFQFFIGGPCLVFLSAPMLLLFSIYWLAFPPEIIDPRYEVIFPLSAGCFIYGMVLHFIFGLIVVRDRKWPNMLLALSVFPFYWLLHSVASFRALHQLFVRPHHWDKTSHGVGDTDQNNTG